MAEMHPVEVADGERAGSEIAWHFGEAAIYLHAYRTPATWISRPS